jgi:hypothetical protein
MARVCDDERDGLIAVLRDFANNGSAYIVPWTSLPLMASMTDHDVALHYAVGESKASTPTRVRAVISELALSGALGPEAKARETQRSQADQKGLADAELVLLLHLLDSCGADLAPLMADPARWRDAAAKSAVAAAAATVRVRRQDIYERIAELTRLLAPVGLVATDGPIQSGWLRVLRDEIEGFGHGVVVVAPSDAPDLGGHLAAVAESATQSAQLAGTVLGMIDYAVLDIRGTIRRWTTELSVLRQAIDRLSMMLDEWPPLMKSVSDALRQPPPEMVAQLRVLRSMLPRMPSADLRSAGDASDDSARSPAVSRVLAARLATIWSMLRACHPADA